MINFGTAPTKGGGFAAGSQGFMQGIMQSKQSQRADVQDERADEQLNIMKKDFELKDLATRGAMFNPIMYAAEKSGNYDAVNTWLKDPNNKAFGGGSITDSIMHDTKSNEFLNKYRGDTGKDYVEGQGVKTYTDGEGNTRYFTPDTFANGSGYGKYRRDVNAAELAAQAKASGKEEKVDKVKELQKAQDVVYKEGYTPTEEEWRNYNTFSDLNNVTKPNAIRLMNTSKPFSDVNDMIMSDKSLAGVDKNMQNQINLTQEQTENQLPAGEKKTIDDDLVTYETLTDLNNQVVDLLKTGGSAQGTLKNALVDTNKLLSSDEFKQLDPKDQRKFLQTISIRSGLGMAGAQILQAISGAGVSEDEYNRIIGNLVGGDIDKVNFQTIQAALQGSTDVVKKRLGSRIKNIPSRNLGEKLTYAQRMERTTSPKAYEPTEGGTRKLEDAPRTVVESGLKGAKGFYDAVFGDKNLGKGEGNLQEFKTTLEGKTHAELSEIANDPKLLADLDAPQRKALLLARRRLRK